MEQPFVSIITPVFNAENSILPFLDALVNQSYPDDKYEVIVVDNGSSDQTLSRIKAHPFSVQLLERTDIQNPYAARNRGLQEAKGKMIALLDVNCKPVHRWLEKGVERLKDAEVDLVGGHISFTFSAEETLGEWYDSLLFVDMEDLIKRGKSCAGGNLFFKRNVYEKVGPFPEDQRSGMDLYWTKKATGMGFNLVYDAQAEVKYPARKLRPLLKKVYRVGTGQPKVWLDNDRHLLKMLLHIPYQFIPPGRRELKEKIRRRGKDEMNEHLGSLWLIHYLQKMTLALGWSKGVFNYYFGK